MVRTIKESRNIRLTFGALARVYYLCAPKNITVEQAVSDIVSCIAPQSRYVTDSNIGNKRSTATKLMNCTIEYVEHIEDVENDKRKEKAKQLATVTKKIETMVIPQIKDVCPKVLLTLLDIIACDSTIEQEHSDTFAHFFGKPKQELLQESKFKVSEFLARVLLYTTCGSVKNKKPQKNKIPNQTTRSGEKVVNRYKRKISRDYIDKVVKSSWVETAWDEKDLTVELIPIAEKKLFDRLSLLNEIRLSLCCQNDLVCDDLSWLGVDMSELFPNRYKGIKLSDEDAKKLMSKMSECAKLVKELVECLKEAPRKGSGIFPNFPNNKMKDLTNRLHVLSDEIFTFSIHAGFHSDR